MKPVKVFTHTDLDGVGSGLIFQYMYGKDDVDITYCDYHKVDELVQKFFKKVTLDDYSKVFITDISVNEETAEIINNHAYVTLDRVVLLDHHDTAKWLNKYDWALVQSEYGAEADHGKTSGTSLVMDWYDKEDGYGISQSIREFAEVVRKYDTWEWSTIYNDDKPKQYSDLLYMIGREEFVDRMFGQIMRDTIDFTEVDKVLLEQKQKEIKKYIEKKDKQMIVKDAPYEGGTWKMGLVFAEQHISELGNELCKMHPEIDFIAMVEMGSKKISFRTVRDDIHLGELAKELGGGGHPKAAGAQFTEEKIINFLGELF